MGNFELALKVAGLVESLTPVATGLVNALLVAFKSNTTLGDLLTGAKQNFSDAKTLAEEELKKL